MKKGLISSPGGIIYVGVDESNGGLPFEIFSGAFSKYIGDYHRVKRRMSKKRGSVNVPEQVELYSGPRRDYSFLLSSRSDKKRIPRRNLLGVILYNLINKTVDFNDKRLRQLRILVDGDNWEPFQVRRAEDILRQDFYLDSRIGISIRFGADFDRRYKCVNAADAIAYNYAENETLKSAGADQQHVRDFDY